MKNARALQTTQDAARLLGTAAPASAHPQARDITDAAVRVLGLTPAAAAPALSAFDRQRAALAQAKGAGLIDRLRRMFGAKS